MSVVSMTWTGFAAMLLIAVSYGWRCAYSTLRPARHRPAAFLFGGLFFLLVAFAFSWMAATAISTGHAHLSHRGYGALDAWRDTEPMLFWLCIAMEYLSGLFICSYAIALVALMDR